MLTEINCKHFRRELKFEPGLNVVHGDGSNSIGKSTALMLVDFALGGSDFVETSIDLVAALGHHDYEFSFLFAERVHRFRRGTNSPDVVLVCGDSFEDVEAWSLEEYTEWLKVAYALEGENVSFRGAVSPYIRVWKRETLEPAGRSTAIVSKRPKLLSINC